MARRQRKMAKPLDPGLDPWEQQDGESPKAYAAFLQFRDSDDRRVAPAGMPTAEASARKRWSASWSWMDRTRAYDRSMAAREADELVRYRTTMNARHRTTAAASQSKFVQWLMTRTPEDVSKWKPMEAVRVWEVAVRIEREASGANLPPAADLLTPEEAKTAGEVQATSLAELFGVDPAMEEALAGAVYGALFPARDD